jgi:PLP dependent protein
VRRSTGDDVSTVQRSDGERLRDTIAEVRSRIGSACRRSGRSPEDVVLVAVAKTVPIGIVREAGRAGIRHFAENYAKELAKKATEVQGTWHFIGKLQRGTASRVADHADVIHSAERGEALERVAARAHQRGRTIPSLVQVDFTGRRQGVGAEDVEAFVDEVQSMAGIRVVGLMTVPPWTGDPEATRTYFSMLRALRDRLAMHHREVRELSMGMSGDYEVAVEEGATMVRVGTALFGPRPARQAR